MTPSDVSYWRVPLSAGSTVCRLLRIAMILMTAALPATAVLAAMSLDDQLKDINSDAQDARESGNLELVERKRRERWKLIGEFAEQTNPPDSPWIAAYKAIEQVDGSESSTTGDTGLLNGLKYKESCTVLKKAFDEMAAQGTGPLLGELATRYFEVSQQAKGVYRDALVAGSPDQVADVSEIATALQVTAKRDPCCVVATAMLLYLEKPDPKEAFLRAEVRGSFKKRQKQLVDLSHPLILPSLQSRSSWLPYNAAEDEAPPAQQTLENKDVPVMPWHAAVELDKAMSLQYILEDLHYTRPLTPDFTVFFDVETKDPQGQASVLQFPLYTFPSQVFAGTDAALSPCRLLYGKLLLARSIEDGRGSRSVAYFPVSNPTTKTVEWDYRYVDLIYRVPTPEELDKSPILKRKHELVTAYAPRARWNLGDQEFHLYDFPIRDAERCLQVGMQVFCVRNKDDFAKLKFVPLRNRADAVAKLETPEDRQFPQSSRSPFATTPLVSRAIAQYSQSSDPTKHALIELMRDDYLNPLVLVSERKAGDLAIKPNLIRSDNPDEPPYVLLDDRVKLHFSLSGLPESPCSLIQYPGATAYFPLIERAIPKPILLGSEIGKAFVGALVNAGYTEGQAIEEIDRAMVVDSHVPDKFRRAIEARVAAVKSAASKKGGDGKDSLAKVGEILHREFGVGDIGKAAAPQLSFAVAALMLNDEGWLGPPRLKPSLQLMFDLYGFRYLRDRRNNWILVRELMEEDGSATTSGNTTGAPTLSKEQERQEQLEARFPFAYIAQDGKRSIDTGQIYSWPSYQQLKDSIYNEHLRKMLSFHPCLAAIEVIDADTMDRLQHPSEHKPEYIKHFQEAASKQGSNQETGGVKDIGDIPELGLPFPAWLMGDDVNQQRSLAALHVAYLHNLTALSVEARRMSEAESLRRFYEQLYLAAFKPKDILAALEGMRDAQARYDAASQRRRKAVTTLEVVQLESGRDYARRRYFHKSIVWYNDLLSQLVSSNRRESRVMLFSDVPTTDTASAFVDNLQGMIQGQSFVLNTQIELAGVLNASGLKPSAHFVWQRTIDDYDFFLKPAIDIARDLLESYGLRMSARAEQTLEGLDDTIQMCREAIDKYGLSVDWRNIQASDGKTSAIGGKQRRNVAAVRRDLERDNENLLSDAERVQLEKECEAISGDRSITFSEWLEWKKALLEIRPTLAFRTTSFSPPWFGFPVSYDTEAGFGESSDAARELVLKADFTSILAWCTKPLEDATKDPIASDASAVLGWYWLDAGQLPAARAAFMNLARVKAASAAERGESLDSLLDELHSFAALTAAGAIVESMPGLSAFKTDFGGLLEGQLRSWEKRWFAQGHYGPHASQQRLELLSRATRVQQQLAGMSRDWRQNRYFFPDYSFEFGAVPDFLVAKLLESPNLFRPLTPEEVKEREENAVEGNQWALINKADAMKFMETFRLSKAVERDIVFLGK
jgi:hypothetical protein